MAPTCHSHTMKNKHYRTQSLPESVYTHQMLHLTQQPYDHHGHHHSHYPQLSSHHHAASHLKKRTGAALRRSQTSVCDLLQGGGLSHHRAPLTAGLYEQFLPPPNFNAIGLPVNNRGGRSRTQSFYYRSPVSSVSPYSYPVCDQSPAWYHRSVPNIASSYPSLASTTNPGKSVTSPLFVDCSVEYDLGEQPVIPADSEPLLSIHPEYVARSQNSSPYPHTSSLRASPLALQIAEKSLSDSAPGRLARRSHPRPSPHRSSRPSPRARASLAAKLEATRKLSVESRDSGIGLMGSGGTMCGYQQAFPSSSPVEPQAYQQTQFTGKVLPTVSNKRFAITDLVSGLLCCSVPPHPVPSSQLNPGCKQNARDMTSTMWSNTSTMANSTFSLSSS